MPFIFYKIFSAFLPPQLTFDFHADVEALLVAAVLATPPARLVDVARRVERALVLLQRLHRPLEEPLAALARQQAVVVT